MTVQIKNIDFYLIKNATMTSIFLLTNYCLWAVNAPVFTKSIVVVLMMINIVFFLVNKPFLAYLPIKIFIISLVLISLGTPTTDWDARFIWLFHAKRIFIDNNLYSQLDTYSGWSHNDYPILIPALSATMANLIGHWNEVVPKFSSVLALCPAIFLLVAVLKSAIQQILLCVLLLLVCNQWLINGYMDGLLAIYYTGASLLAYIMIQKDFESYFNITQRLWLSFLSVLIFSILTLIKNEGLVALFVLLSAILCSLFFVKGIKIKRINVIVFLVSIVPILIWKIICINNGVVNDLVHSDLIAQLFSRFYSIDSYLLILEYFVMDSYIFIPLLVFIFVFFNTKDRNINLFVTFCALFYFGVIFMVYLSTPFDLTWHLSSSASRTILPIGLVLGYFSIVTYKKF